MLATGYAMPTATLDATYAKEKNNEDFLFLFLKNDLSRIHYKYDQMANQIPNDTFTWSKETAYFPSADFAYPLLHRASCMLSPTYASESHAKYLSAASQASTSVRVTTGIIRIRDVTFTESNLDWSLGKNGHLNIVLSFQLEESDANSVNSHEAVGLLSWKSNPSVPRSWFYCVFLWIMILSLSLKIRSLVCPRSYMSWRVDVQRVNGQLCSLPTETSRCFVIMRFWSDWATPGEGNCVFLNFRKLLVITIERSHDNTNT